MSHKTALIIGAGPAGLTVAYELLSRSGEYEVFVFEESTCMGGISRTVNHNGNRMDMGGHRFFSKVPEVNQWWEKILPSQGALPYDDKILGRKSRVTPGGPNPDKTDRVMLIRSRLSRIFFRHKFFDYPVSLKFSTIKSMGLLTTIEAGFSYMMSAIRKRPEKSLEDFYINRFGRKLYSMFFENYTQNLWGRHPSEISPEWGAQRVKGLSIMAIIRDILGKMFHVKSRKVETSLIEEFAYPKLGPGQLWEITADEIRRMGGKIITGAKVTGFHRAGNIIDSLTYEKDGVTLTAQGDIVISSMPVKDLIAGMNDVPERVAYIASGLPYRDYMTAGVLVKSLKLKNETSIKTLGGIIPDNWIYIHEKGVRMGRIQVFNNWSPYMVKDPKNTVWLGLEYFCSEGDSLWSMNDEDFSRMAAGELVKMGMIESPEDVIDSHVERVKKAYPAYFDTYAYMDELRRFLDGMTNLYCIGRNGQHRYNNIDHSMCTAFEAVRSILSGSNDKSNVWNVNTEKEYHESK
ncbi:MAG: NAD(P)/FAD-dependent oxidoreductase [Synergistaceae bacterium]|nr:NAD(P)/FAD-dependent oxidoreductase [Synergistaceae bacterium]